MALDPEDARAPYKQVASALRAQILTAQIAPSEKLPSQKQLSETFGVSRMTIQQALRTLKNDGPVLSRQGSGVFARAKETNQAEMATIISGALQKGSLNIDAAGQSASLLSQILRSAQQVVTSGHAEVQEVNLRVLLPGPNTLPLDSTHSHPFLRLHNLAREDLVSTVFPWKQFAESGLVTHYFGELRELAEPPGFDLAVVNNRFVFHEFRKIKSIEINSSDGFYKLDAIHDVPKEGKKITIHEVTEEPGDFARLAIEWFDEAWLSTSNSHSEAL